MFLKLYLLTTEKFLYKDIGVFTANVFFLFLFFLKVLFYLGYITTSFYDFVYPIYSNAFAIILLYPYYMGFIQLNYWILLTPKDEEYLNLLTNINYK